MDHGNANSLLYWSPIRRDASICCMYLIPKLISVLSQHSDEPGSFFSDEPGSFFSET